MNKKNKTKFREKKSEDIEKEIKKLEFELLKFRGNSKGWGFHPQKGSPTTMIRQTRRDIAFLKTILNQKRQIKASIISCEGKNEKNRARRLKGKMKKLKCL